MGFGFKQIRFILPYNNNKQVTMTVPGRNSEPKRRYAKISLKKRQTLVDLVLQQGRGLTKTAKKLNLKLSTAKLILRKFKQTGKFHIRKLRETTFPAEAAASGAQQFNAASKFEESPWNNKQKDQQIMACPQFMYPVMYGEACYPFLGYYGMWDCQNYYQII